MAHRLPGVRRLIWCVGCAKLNVAWAFACDPGMFDKLPSEYRQFRILRFQISDWPCSYRTYSTYGNYFGQINLKSEIVMRSEIGDALYSSRQTKYKALSPTL